MTNKLSKEQDKFFMDQAEEVFLNIQRTAEVLTWGVVELLKEFGLTPTQYNVLRILRGAKEGLTCNEIAARMVTRDSDMTRLLDRLEKLALVRRERGEKDRRIVLTFITKEGLELVNNLDEPIKQFHGQQLSHVSSQELSSLSQLLELVCKKIS